MPPDNVTASVVLPVFNGEPYLRECLDSVLAQRFADFELVIADDGSSDRSRDIVLEYADPRIRLLPSETRRGLFGNLNRCVRAARGTWIKVLCQDDALGPDCLHTTDAFFRRHRDVGLIYLKADTVDERGRVVSRPVPGDLPEIIPPMLSQQHFFYHGCFLGNLTNAAFRKSAWEKVGPFDESYGVSADYEMWARLCRTLDMGVIHVPLVRVRAHEGQLSRSWKAGVEFVAQNRRVRAAVLPFLPESVRAEAARYERWRHFVLDFHFALRCARHGRWRELAGVLRALGPRETWHAAVAWLLTVDNRLHRPQAPWVLPSSDCVGQGAAPGNRA